MSTRLTLATGCARLVGGAPDEGVGGAEVGRLGRRRGEPLQRLGDAGDAGERVEKSAIAARPLP